MRRSLSNLRRDFSLMNLSKKDVSPDPFIQFAKWYDEASQNISGEANAMILSTAGKNGRPSSRVVLLKEFSERGLVFFTNYTSRKGNNLNENPFAAVLFFWAEMERQVRIEGGIDRLSTEESMIYFNSRPRQSQLGAVASDQSKPLKSRNELEQRFLELENEFHGKDIPRPFQWGGYVLKPDYFEFWQGRQSRLHDRISYSLLNNHWMIQRLYP